VLTEPTGYPEPTSVSITRLVCVTVVILTVLIGGGLLLLLRPELGKSGRLVHPVRRRIGGHGNEGR